MRSVTAAGFLALALAGVGLVRLVAPAEPVRIEEASPCAWPVEQIGRGVSCDRKDGTRPGDRIDSAGRVVGRISPEALAVLGVAVDPNRASAEELASLPGIGPALAQRIVEERQRGGAFERVKALLRVRGIGPKLLLRMRARLTVER